MTPVHTYRSAEHVSTVVSVHEACDKTGDVGGELQKLKRTRSAARTAYTSNLINTNRNNPQFLFDAVMKPVNCSSPIACDYLKFFINKIDLIRDKHQWSKLLSDG